MLSQMLLHRSGRKITDSAGLVQNSAANIEGGPIREFSGSLFRRSSVVATIIVVLGSLVVGNPHASAATKRIRRCVVRVDGKTYLDRPCDFTPESDGSFEISDPRIVLGCVRDNGSTDRNVDTCPSFAQVYVVRKGVFLSVDISPDGTGEVHWNRGTDTHAMDNLGSVTRNGGCWSNVRTKICAYA
jgi:hypothetical protein